MIYGLLILTLLLSPFANVSAAINKQVNYQGKLTDSAGLAVPNGDYNMEFILYDDPTLSGVHILWTETRTGVDKVTVTSGIFSILLGSVTSLAGVDFNQTLYLGVNIGGTGAPAWDGEMTPRKKIGSVPTAILADNALTVDGLTITSSKILTATNTLTLSGTDGSTLNIGTGGTLGTGAYANISDYLPLAGGTLTGHLLFTDNTYDIGALDATRPRTGYFGTSLFSPLVVGGTGTTQDLTFQTTTGVGAAGADMHFLVGNNGGTEAMTILNDGKVGIGTNAPTHSLTLPSTSSGIALYNTVDQTTNYERGIIKWASNQLLIGGENGGTGSARAVKLQASSGGAYSTITLQRGAVPFMGVDVGGTAVAGNLYQFTLTGSQSSGTTNVVALTPVYNQTGTAANTDFLINRTETAVGSGAQYLIDAQVGSASKFRVTNTGLGYFAGNVGIGTTAPLRRLDVAGSGRITGTATSVLTGTIDPAASTTVTGVGTAFLTELVIGDRITVTGETRTVTAIASDTSLTVNTAFSDNANDTSPDKLSAIFIARDSSGAVKLVTNDLGNVGIGVTAPGYNLAVGGTGYYSGALTIGGYTLPNTDGPASYFLQTNGSGVVTWQPVTGSQVFKGTWDASTNTPTLADGVGTAGWYYRVVVAGTQDLGSGNINFFSGDDVSYNGTIWQRIPSGAGTVTSVSVVNANGFDGTVSNPSTTPAITIKTTITGLIKGDGTAISAAVADTDYLTPGTAASTYLPLAGGVMVGDIFMTSNKLIGGSTTTSDLILQTTSGVGTTGADMHFLVGNNGATEAMTILNNGNVGIGTASPAFSAQFVGASSYAFDSGGGNNYIYVRKGSTSNLAIEALGTSGRIQAQSSVDLELFNTLGTGIILKNSGNVGINTVVPTGQLSVTPTQYSTGTASQSLTTVTGVGTTWTSAMVGSQLVYADGTNGGTITGFTDITHITVSTSQTVSPAQNYKIMYTGLQVASAGNIGIGTTAPGQQLHVNNPVSGGDSYIQLTNADSGTTGANGLLIGGLFNSGINTQIWNYENGYLRFATNNTEQVRITAGGNIGIGTTVPQDKIGIAQSGGISFQTTDATLNSGIGAQIYPAVQGSGNSHLYFKTNQGGSGGDVRMAILNTGNVGIGTILPKDKLHVAGGLLVIDNAQQLVARNTADNGNVQLIGTNGAANTILIGGANAGGAISFNDGNGVKMYYANGKLRVGDNTAPTNNLEIQGTASFSGNVGIGTATVSADNLHVGDGTGTRYIAVDGAIAAESGYKIGKAGVDKWKIYQATSSNDLRIYDVTNTNNVITFQSGGNVGVGVTNPTTQFQLGTGTLNYANGANDAYIAGDLEVDGTIYGNVSGSINPGFTQGSVVFAGASALAQDNANFFWDDSTDRLGLGTASPGTKLDVIINTVGTNTFAQFGPTTIDGSTREGGIKLFASTGSADKTFAVWNDANTPQGLRFEYLGTRATALGSGTNVMVMQGDGNVGIGTTASLLSSFTAGDKGLTIFNNYGNRASVLELTGSSGANYGTGNPIGLIRFGNDEGGSVYDELAEIRVYADNSDIDTGSMALRTATNGALSTAMTILYNGNVGIGTTDPQVNLAVQSTASNGAISVLGRLVNPGSGSGTGASLQLGYGNNGNSAIAGFYDGIGDAFSISTRPTSGGTLTERIRVVSTGNVGINTVVPTGQLSVTPTQYSTGTASQSLGTVTGTGTTFTSAMVGSQLVYADGTNGGTITGFTDTTHITVSTSQTVSPAQNYKIMYTGLQVASSGNIGIGVTNPTDGLEISNSDFSSGTGNLRITGIRPGIRLKETDGSADQNWQLENSAGKFLLGTNNDAFGNFQTKVTVQQDGNVGINTTTPTTFKLEVAGNVGPEADNTRDLGSGARRWANLYATNIVSTGATLSGLTQGSVIFAGASGALSQDNANFFFDDTNNTFGVGTTRTGAISATNARALVKGSGTTSSTSTFEVQDSSGASKLFVRDDGFVGIGVNASIGSEQLRIYRNNTATYSNLRLDQASTGDVGLSFVLTGIRAYHLGIDNSDGDKFKIGSDSSDIGTGNFFTIDGANSGNVGIGTTAPGTKLEIRNDTASVDYSLTLSNDDGTATNLSGAGIKFGRLNTPWAGISGQQQDVSDYNYGKLNFATRTSTAAGLETKMTILANGNVGIATTVPTKKFEVAGTALIGNAANSSTLFPLTLDGLAVSDGFNPLGDYGGLLLSASSGYTSAARQYLITNALGTDKFAIIRSAVSTSTPGLGTAGVVTSGTADFVIDNGGNVGIGTTTPGYRLEVPSNNSSLLGLAITDSTDAYNKRALIYDGGTEAGILELFDSSEVSQVALKANGSSYITGGNVGIGTAGPGAKLEVASILDDNVLISSTRNVAGINLMNLRGNRGTANVANTNTVGFRITADSNTTANSMVADIRLIQEEVTHATRQTALGLYAQAPGGASPTEIMRVSGTGNVGIGTTAPDRLLTLARSSNGVEGVRITNSNTGTGAYASIILAASGGNTTYHHFGGSYTTSGRFIQNSGLIESSATGGLSLSASDASGVIRFYTNANNERMRVAADGNVGIGTTGPGAPLEVRGSTSRLSRADATYGPYLDFYAGASGTTQQWRIGSGVSAGLFDFQIMNQSSSPKLTILQDGNVGIGTTGPQDKLQVTGTVSTLGDSRFIARFGDDTNMAAGVGGGVGFTGEATTGSDTQTVFSAIWGEKENGTTTETGGQLHLGTRVNGGTISSDLVIDSAGYVGIGTTAPTQALDVRSIARVWNGTNGIELSYSTGNTSGIVASANTSGNLEFRTNIGSSGKMFIENGGNVGIGTTSPNSLLSLGGTPTITTDTSDGFDTKRLSLAGAGATGVTRGAYIQLSGNEHATDPGRLLLRAGGIAGSYIDFSAADTGTTQMILDKNGNVGIGTTAPGNLLHLSQTSADTVLKIGNNSTYDQYIFFNGNNDWTMGIDYSNSNAFTLSNNSALGTATKLVVDTSGNLGIGDDTPTYKLDVNGTGRFTGAATFDSTVGVGGAPVSTWGVNVVPTTLSGTTQSGVRVDITGTSAATTYVAALDVRAGTAAAAYTASSVYGLFIANPSKGAGSTITTAYGLYIAGQTVGATNYAVYTAGTTPSYFGGAVTMNSSLSTTGQLLLADGTYTAPSLAFTGDTAHGFYRRTAGVIGIVDGNVKEIEFAGTHIRMAASGVVEWSATEDASGSPDTNLYRASANYLKTDDDFGALALRINGAQVISSSQNLTLTGTGPHAIGSATSDSIRLNLNGSFTSGGSGTTASALVVQGMIMAATGDTTWSTGTYLNNTITTQGATEVIGNVAQLTINEPQITVGTGDTITNASTVRIIAAPDEATNNYALWVDSGNTRLDGATELQSTLSVTGTSTLTGAVGFGIAPSTARWLNIGATLSGSANQYGIFSNPTFGSDATTLATAIYAKGATTAAVFTAPSVRGVYIADATKGAGSTITTQYGLYIDSLTTGDTNYAVYTAGTTPSYFGGAATITGISYLKSNVYIGNNSSWPRILLDGAGATGITFGDGSSLLDVNLYRSAANVLKTDDDLIVAGRGAFNGATIESTVGIATKSAGDTSGTLSFIARNNSGALALGVYGDKSVTVGGNLVVGGASASTDIYVNGGVNLNASLRLTESGDSGFRYLYDGTANTLVLTSGTSGGYGVTQATYTRDAAGVTFAGTLAVTGTSTLTGSVGVGGASDSTQGIRITSSALTGTGQIGIAAQPVASSSATSYIRAVYGRADTAAASFTVTSAAAFNAANASKGAGSTITTQYGLYVDDLTSGATNYAIYTAGTTSSYFGGNLGVGDASPASLFTVGSGDLFQVNSSGDIVKLKNLTYSWPSSHTTNGVLTNNGSGTLTWSTIGSSGITADSLDFTEFQDTLDLDANLILNQAAFTWVQNYTGTAGAGLTYNATGAIASGNAAIDINVSNASTAIPALMVTNAGSSFALRVNDDGTTTDSTPFVVAADGKVGIGTTAPSSILHLEDTSSNAVLTIKSGNSSTPIIDFFDAGARRARISATTGDGLQFDTNGTTTAMTIISSGNVGIGTTNPTSPLDVEKASGNLALGASTAAIEIVSSSNVVNGLAELKFGGKTDTIGAAIGYRHRSGTTNTAGDLVFATRNAVADADLTERLRILSTGNVGINTLSPTNLFSVTPTQYTTGTASQSTTTVTGVGTTWTSAMVGSQLVYADGTNGGTITAFGSTTSLTVDTSQTVSSQSYKILYTGLQVASAGKVGIGVTNPSGNGDASSLQVQRNIILGNDNLNSSYILSDLNLALMAEADVMIIADSNDNSGPAASDIVFGGGSSSTTFGDTYANYGGLPRNEWARFQGTTGNFGVGTASPSALFSVGSSSQFQVSSAGAVTAVGVNAGAGLLQGSLGLTITGAVASINNSSNFATDINTGTSTGAVSIGGGSGTVAVNSTSWDISTLGVASGFTGFTSSGTVNFSGLTASRLVATDASKNLVSTITAANLLASVTGTTGTGNLVFATSPTLTTLTVSSGGIAVTGNSTITGTLTGLTGVTSSGSITFSGLTAARAVCTTTGGLLTSSCTSQYFIDSVSNETGTGSLVFGTSPTFTTKITTPLVLGGTSTTQDLSFQTTSGVGATGADMHFLVGNNGGTEAMTILNNGNVGIGIATPVTKLGIDGGGLLLGNGTTRNDFYVSERVDRAATDNTSSDIWYKFATIPVTATSNGPTLKISFTGGKYIYNEKDLLDIIVTSREGFDAHIMNATVGSSINTAGVVIYQEVDLSYSLYIKLTGGQYSSGQVAIQDGSWNEGATFIDITDGSPSDTSTPSGTLVFDSTDSAYYTGITFDYVNEKVGIGLTNPGGILDIYNSGTADTSPTLLRARYYDTDSGPAVTGDFNVTNKTLSFISSITGTETQMYVEDKDNTAARLTFDFRGNAGANLIMAGTSTGNVGIGITAPTRNLHISGAGTVGIRFTNTSGASTNDVLYTTGADTAGMRLLMSPGGPLIIGGGESAGAIDTNVAVGSEETYIASDNTGTSRAINFLTSLQTSGWAGRVEAMTILGNGNVGIGDISPESPLEINHATAAYIDLENTTTQTASGIKFTNASTLKWTLKKDYINGDHNLVFQDASSNNVLFLQQGGNVGIGTTAPGHTLEINDTVTNNLNGTDWSMLLYDTSATAQGVGGGLLFGGEKSAAGANGYFAAIEGIKENATDANEAGALVFYTNPAATSQTEKMRITSTGNIGIGTTTPNAQLAVSTTNSSLTNAVGQTITAVFNPASALSYYPTGLAVSPTYNSTFNATGFITGVRSFLTESNSGTINVRNFDILTTNSGAGTISSISDIQIRAAANSGGGAITNYYGLYIEDQTVATNNFAIYTTGSTKSYFGGNVGIGTTNPLVKLDAQNTGATNVWIGASQTGTGSAGFVFDASNGDYAGGDYGELFQNNDLSIDLMQVGANPLHLGTSNVRRLTILADGNVGIGDISPAALLAVGNGDLFQVSSAGAVTAVGVNAGAGLLQGSLGLTITGAVASINNSSNFATNINTGTSTGAVSIGGGSGTVAVNSTSWNISTTGVASGFTGITSSGTNSFTGAVTNLGVSATTGANLNVFGPGTGQTEGGQINIQPASDYIGVTTAWGIDVYQNQLRIFPTGGTGGTGTYLTVDNNTQAMALGRAAGTLTLNGTLSTTGPTTLGDNGDNVTINSNVWDITGAGVASGFTGFASTGTIAFSGAGAFSIDSSAFDVTTGGALSGITTLGMSSTLTLSGSAANIALGSNWLSGDGGDEGVTVDANGNVGVGTASPGAYKLYVNGTSYFAGDITLASGGSITSTGTSTFSTSVTTPLLIGGTAVGSNITYKSTTAAGTTTGIAHQFVGGTNGGTTIMTMLNNGNVGIGTASPKDKLHVSGLIVLDNNQQLVARNLLDNGNVQLIGTNGASNNLLIGGTGISSLISFNDGNGIKMVYSNAKLRIGDSSTPSNALEVVGVGTFSSNVGIGGAAATAYTLTVGDGTNSRFVTTDGAIASTVGFRINKAGSEEWAIYQPASSNDLRFTDVDGGAGDMVTFQSGGNVGIGTTAPGYLLDLLADTPGASPAQLRLSNVSTNSTTKNAKILTRHYLSAEEDFLALQFISSATDNTVVMGGSSGSYNTATKLSFFTAANNITVSGTERMTIISDGNVGIGDTTPSYKLDVAGDINTTGTFRVNGTAISASQWTTTGSDIYYSTGNVGIGTATPAGKLDVFVSGAVGANYDPTSGMLSSSGVTVNSLANLVDNDTGTQAYHTDSAVPGAYVKMDLGASNDKDYVKARMYVNNTYAGNYNVEYSDNDSTWNSATTNFTPTTSGWYEKTWTSVGAHRYWRFYLTNTPGAGAWVNEIQMYTAGSSTLFVDAASGNVGISTTTPSAKLDVAGELKVGAVASSTLAAGMIQWDGSNFKGYDGSTWKTLDVQSTSGGGWTDGGAVVYTTTSSDHVSIGTTSDIGRLGVYSGSAGAYTANSGADEIVIEHSGAGGMSIVTPDASNSSIMFGSPSDVSGAIVRWNYNAHLMEVGTVTGSSGLDLQYDNGSSGIRLVSGGNVGIGDTNPTEAKLSLISTNGSAAYLTGTSAANGSDPVTLTLHDTLNSAGWTAEAIFSQIKFDSDDTSGPGAGTKTKIASVFENTAGSLAALSFYTSSSTLGERMRIDPTGNVGVGTTNPTRLITINDATEATLGLYTSDGERVTMRADASSNFKIDIAGSEQFRIISGGNVGISDNSPTEAKLVVQGSNGGLAYFRGTSSVTGSDPVALTLRDTSNSGSWTIGAAFAQIKFDSEDLSGLGATTRAKISAVTESTAGALTGLSFITSNASTLTEGMRIDSSGNVGVGTTNPKRQFEVNHASSPLIGMYVGDVESVTMAATGTTTSSLFRLDVGGAGTFWVNASKQMSVGASGTTGTNLLNINSVADGDGIVIRGSSTSNNADSASVQFGDSTNATVAKIIGSRGSVFNDGYIKFQTMSGGTLSNRLYIASTGNIGITDTTPTEAMLVVGSGGAGDIYASFATASANGLCWDGTGASLITDCSSAPTDLAENFGTTDATIVAGDLVVVDSTQEGSIVDFTDDLGNVSLSSKSWILKATNSTRKMLLGVVSTNPNQVYGDDGLFDPSENPTPVTLAGRVPVNVANTSPAIAIGDPVTVSSYTPGKAAKATNPGMIIGTALSSYNPNNPPADGKILVFIKVEWYGGELDEITNVLNFNSGLSLAGGLEIKSSDLGDGLAGPVLTLGRNTNAVNSAAGSINFINKDGTAGYVWQDVAGNLRINNVAPDSANDTSGTIVGAQTSTRETKQDIADYTDYNGALEKVINAPLHTFRYIKEVQGYGENSPLAKLRIGYIADEVDPQFMVGNVIDQVSVNGLLMASVKALDIKITSVEERLAALEASVGTGSGLTSSFGDLATEFFSSGLTGMKDGIAYMKGIVTESLTIGSSQKRTGITFFDEVTGDPYCVSIANGTQKVTNGSCIPVDITTPADTQLATSGDTIAPIVTLDGDSVISLNVGDTYTEAGALATDDTDGDVPVVISGDVDTSIPGTYTITYYAIDSAGNPSIETTRTVTVASADTGSTTTTTTTTTTDPAPTTDTSATTEPTATTPSTDTTTTTTPDPATDTTTTTTTTL